MFSDFFLVAMSVTASGVDASPRGSDLRRLAVEVYEAAADACLLAGNLGFYCVCSSRLLGDLYPSIPPAAREAEFRSLSILYYSCYVRDNLELARCLRRLSPALLADEGVRLALTVAKLRACGREMELLKVYDGLGTRARTILQPALKGFRTEVAGALVKAYLSLDAAVAARWLSCTVEEAREVIVKAAPRLAEVNAGGKDVLAFRGKK